MATSRNNPGAHGLARAPAAADPMLPRPYRVTRKARETSDTVTLSLEPQDEGAALVFLPGQFNMLYAFGIGEVPISISGDPGKLATARATRPLSHTIRAVGPVTRALCAAKRGDIIGVRGPYGTAWPMHRARGDDIVLIAGGIGLAPLRPAFYHILANRRAYGRVSLIYGARSPADLLFRKELERWRGQFGLEVEVTVDHAGPDDEWHGPVGVVTRLLSRIRFDALDATAMLCGPEVMMRFGVRELHRHGMPDDSIYLSMERNMKCAIGFCGHCQFGPTFVCKDGPVFRHDSIDRLLNIPEI